MSENGRNYFGTREVTPNQHAICTVLEDNQDLYLCGLAFNKFLDPEISFFRKLQNYLQDDLSYECSALAMFALKSIPSSKIVQGIITEGDELYRHAWAEFTFGQEEFVADPAWTIPFIVPKMLYKKHFALIEPKWYCEYNKFWEYPLTKSFYENMKKSYTSEGLFELLEEYGKSYDVDKEDYGFRAGARGSVHNTDFFCPYIRNGHPLSTAIIEDLIENPELDAPTQENIILAESLIDILNSIQF